MKYLDFIRKYAKQIGWFFWGSLLLYLFVVKYEMNPTLAWLHFIETALDTWYWLITLPSELWKDLFEFMAHVKTFLIGMWENKSWWKVIAFILIGITKRFLIENIIIEMFTRNFVSKFKDNKIIWIQLLMIPTVRFVRDLGITIYLVFIASVGSIAVGILGNTIISFIKKIIINKLLSGLKVIFLTLLPLVFAFILEGVWHIAIFLEYIIFVYMVKWLLKVPFIGKPIAKKMGWLLAYLKTLDDKVKKWAVEWPKGKLKMKGYLYKSHVRVWIMNMGWDSPEQAEHYLNTRKRKKIIIKKRASRLRSMRLRIKGWWSRLRNKEEKK